jgi:hypothetical protein
MFRTMLRLGLPLAAFAAVVVGGAVRADPKDAKGFKPLFNGKDFTGWQFELGKGGEPGKTFQVKDGIIVVSGKPNGYFYTDKDYKNYVLRYDWQYKRPAKLTDDKEFKGNSGCLVHIQPPQKVWPKCVEVQGMNLNHGMILYVSGAKGLEKAKFDRAAKDKATRPVGEWNTTEIVCKADGSVSAKINGTPVSSGKSDLTEGRIGFQSEGAEIHFKNILIKEMR